MSYCIFLIIVCENYHRLHMSNQNTSLAQLKRNNKPLSGYLVRCLAMQHTSWTQDCICSYSTWPQTLELLVFLASRNSSVHFELARSRQWMQRIKFRCLFRLWTVLRVDLSVVVYHGRCQVKSLVYRSNTTLSESRDDVHRWHTEALTLVSACKSRYTEYICI